MVTLANSLLIKALQLYFECKSSYKSFEKQWKKMDYGNSQIPSRKFMYRLANRFEKTGSILKRKPTGRPKSVRNIENSYAVAQKMVEIPGISARNCAKALGLDRCTVRDILKKDIQWKPFKARIVHMLNNNDYNRRFWFCEDMMKFLGNDSEILNNFLFMDEVFVKLNGNMCTRNLYFWDSENPNMVVERKLNGYGLMFLVCISVRGILVYCFDSLEIPTRYEQIKRKNNVYRKMPCNSSTFLYILRERMTKNDLQILFPDLPVSEIIPCMDGSRVHTEREVTAFMNSTFNVWIGNNSPHYQWPR